MALTRVRDCSENPFYFGLAEIKRLKRKARAVGNAQLIKIHKWNVQWYTSI